MAASVTVTLRHGVEIPLLGLGTHMMTGKQCTEAVHAALQLGVTMFDTASAQHCPCHCSSAFQSAVTCAKRCECSAVRQRVDHRRGPQE